MKDYYELLGVPADASQAVIEQALAAYQTTLQERLGDPLQMNAARRALNEDVPAIKLHLLTKRATRMEYDQRLAAAKQPASPSELADDEGLDDEQPQPFFFDPYDGYDTETPALTLRQIALKLDTDWARTVGWIKSASQDTHVLVGYLTFAADRQRLASHIEHIIQSVSTKDSSAIDVNEGIERCIEILHPDIERPHIVVQDAYFNGRAYVFHLGELLPERVVPVELVLAHEGIRGCAFGTIETNETWIRFPDGATSTRFALMPVDTDPAIGATEKTFKVFFNVGQLKPYADYTTELLLNLENFNPPVKIPLHVHFHVQARPPRAVFEPNIAPGKPILVGAHKRGELISIKVLAKNAGDEEQIPLSAHIAAPSVIADAKPALFHNNETLMLSINTSTFATGKPFSVAFPLDYSSIPGASGPPALVVEGSIYPTIWQSMILRRSLAERFVLAVGAGLTGWVLLAILMANMMSNPSAWWLLLVVVPPLCAGIAWFSTITLSKHAKVAQDSNVQQKTLSPWWRWRTLFICGLVVALLCTLFPNTPFALWASLLTGGIVGFIGGFIIDTMTQASSNTGYRR
ncbi:MAG: hypothetical protein E6J34_16940 [Chloroflexi bacterium]|nr:MAG: hypothetical protein E6J34_16940 [Chloroflexota bacterium]